MNYNHSLRNPSALATILLSLNLVPPAAQPLAQQPRPNLAMSQPCDARPNLSLSRKLADSSADGEFFVSAGRDSRIRYGRTEDGVVLRTFYLCRPEAVAVSADARLIAAIGNFNGCTSELKVWNARDGSVLRVIDTEFGGESLLFSDDGMFLASIAEESTVELWSLATGLRIRVETLPRKILRLAFTHKNNGALVVLSEDSRATQFFLRSSSKAP